MLCGLRGRRGRAALEALDLGLEGVDRLRSLTASGFWGGIGQQGVELDLWRRPGPEVDAVLDVGRELGLAHVDARGLLVLLEVGLGG